MRLTAGGLLLLFAAACGGASGSDNLNAGGPSATPAPLTQASLQPPVRTTTPANDRTYAPEPVPVTAQTTGAVQASAGSGSTGPGRRTSPAPSPSPRPTPSAVGGTVTVTDDDTGATVRLGIGQRLRVQLSQGTWDPPVSTDKGVVVRRTSSGGYPSDQPVDATFEAMAAGSADITAQSDAACFHSEPRCLMASREWKVHVDVR